MLFANELLLSTSVLATQLVGYVAAASGQDAVATHEVRMPIATLIFNKRLSFDPMQILYANVTAECDVTPALENFPTDFFSNQGRKEGAILLHMFIAFYFFIILGTVCSRYFIPSVECICEDLNIPPNVAAATFMSLATTTPEFFTNTISTFIADSNMGLGTIIGSMLFNTLGVSAVAGLATKSHIKLEHWPILRDCVIFSINLTILAIISWDGVIMWYESLLMVVILILYFSVMFQSVRMQGFAREVTMGKKRYDVEAHPTQKLQKNMDVGAFRVTNDSSNLKMEPVKQPIYTIEMMHCQKPIEKSSDPPVKAPKFWDRPAFNIFWWLFTWPIRIALTIAIPKARMERRIYLATFLMSILVLAFTSYIIFWMISIIGYTFGIPESIMGMTLLAAGGCLPEATSSFIMARKGNGDIGVSNSLGANSLAILFSLGIPWFLKLMARGGPFTNAFINIQSDGMEYVVISLIAAVVTLYLVLRISGYNLRKTVGVVLFVAYTIFVAFPILVEMNVLLPNDNNKC